MDNRRYKFQKYFNKWISIFASGAIYNSYQGAIYHNSIGFRTSNSHVIFNAIDSNKFRPNRVMSAVVKKSHKIPLGSKVILYPARVDPMKNHDLVLKVAKILPEFNFVFIGRGTELLNTSANCFAVGQVLAPENYYNIADLTLCFSRYGEGFPNVVGESLSCGVAVLAQPVGDVEIILENGGGFLIDSDDPTIVAEEIKTIFQNKRALKNVEMAGRRQVIENFSVRAMVGAYKDLLSQK